MHLTVRMGPNVIPRPSSMRFLRHFGLPRPNAAQYRTLIAAPRPGSGPLMERRPDRELPDIQSSSRRWLRTLPLFLAILGASTLGIFNYQKASSSVVNSTLYALRTNPRARELLGDEIYFAAKVPWIWGEMNQLHGRINIHFKVKGTRQHGTMRFRSERKSRLGYFETLEWSLETADGQKIELLDKTRPDPFKNTALKAEPELQA